MSRLSHIRVIASAAAVAASVSACSSSGVIGPGGSSGSVTASITSCSDSPAGFSASYVITNDSDSEAIVTPSFTVNSQPIQVGFVKAIAVPAHSSLPKTIVSYSYVDASPGAVKCDVSLLIS